MTALNGGASTGIDCPMARCSGEVVYNGNYFCSRLGNGCNWALSSSDRTGEPIGKRDKAVWEQIKPWIKANYEGYDDL